MEQKDWDKIAERKKNNIVLGQAINNVSKIYSSVEGILNKEGSFKEEVKKTYKLYKEIHKELKESGESL